MKFSERIFVVFVTMAKLEELGIETQTVDHPEVFTVEEMMPHVEHLPGVHCKNLFMKDKKKKLWLLSCRHDAAVNLGDLAKKVGAPGGLRFADESILFEKLGVKQGCVTAFALINDTSGDVKFIIDEVLLNDSSERVFFHPMSNAASTGITPADLKKFLEGIGHEYTPISL